MNDKKKKKYERPEAELVEYVDDDIILTSLTEGESDPGFADGEFWG